MRAFLKYLMEKDTFWRSLKTALLVGTVLALINHYQEIIDLDLKGRALVQTVVTYLVPFSVASYGQIMGKWQRDKLVANNREASKLPAATAPSAAADTEPRL